MSMQDFIQEFILWNNTHNLMSKKEIDNIDEHIEDSLSLCEFIVQSPHKVIIDIGSGGGFPAIPLAFWIKEHHLDKKIIATDIVAKKLSFLKWCGIKYELDMDVEDLNRKYLFEEPCLIISRAFSSIKNILRWRDKHAPFSEDFLLLKGNSVYQELEEAGITDYDMIKNPRGFIIKFDDLKI